MNPVAGKGVLLRVSGMKARLPSWAISHLPYNLSREVKCWDYSIAIFQVWGRCDFARMDIVNDKTESLSQMASMVSVDFQLGRI